MVKLVPLTTPGKSRKPGSAKGQIWLTRVFDAIRRDFQDYVRASLASKRTGDKGQEHVYKSDGTLTHMERHDLKKDLNTLNQDIKKEKHDFQQR